MTANSENVLLLSDFNVEVFGRILSNDAGQPTVAAISADFGQVRQSLLDANARCWQNSCTSAVVWTLPQCVSATFRKALSFQRVSTQAILDEVDEYTAMIASAAERVSCTLIPTWLMPDYMVGYGILDLKPGTGLRALLLSMNARLVENLGNIPGVFVLDASRWTKGDVHSFSPQMWYLAKVPFGNVFYRNAARDIKVALTAMRGRSRKVILVDLDDTLWGDAVGEVGWEHIRLGGHDPIGEAFVDFQICLKALMNRGVLLGIISKNDETVALKAIDAHPEMVLRRHDFAGWRINWNDKAANIIEIMAELNLGLESAVFIDDNPTERSRVRDALPEVLVPEMPVDNMLAPMTLLQLTCFNSPVLSDEDFGRANMYRDQNARARSRQACSSIEHWLATLETRVVVEPLSSENSARVCQLLNKTNQMNLSTRRMTENELLQWASHHDHCAFAIRVSDRFGDNGIVGIVSANASSRGMCLVDFVLSCRVIGRRLEETMLHVIVSYARSLRLDRLCGTLIPTEKNGPCLEFFRRSGFVGDECGFRFTWDVSQIYPCPDCVDLVMPDSAFRDDEG